MRGSGVRKRGCARLVSVWEGGRVIDWVGSEWVSTSVMYIRPASFAVCVYSFGFISFRFVSFPVQPFYSVHTVPFIVHSRAAPLL